MESYKVFASVKVTNGLLKGPVQLHHTHQPVTLVLLSDASDSRVLPLFLLTIEIVFRENYKCVSLSHLIHTNMYKANSNVDQDTNQGLWLLAPSPNSGLTCSFLCPHSWLWIATGIRLENLLVKEEIKEDQKAGWGAGWSSLQGSWEKNALCFAFVSLSRWPTAGGQLGQTCAGQLTGWLELSYWQLQSNGGKRCFNWLVQGKRHESKVTRKD